MCPQAEAYARSKANPNVQPFVDFYIACVGETPFAVNQKNVIFAHF